MKSTYQTYIFLRFGIFLFLSAFSIACQANNCNKQLYFNEDKAITVSGIVESVVFWGPPNFGENPKTDKRYTGALLHLDCPINIPLTSKPGAYDGNVGNSVNKDNLISVQDNKIFVLNVRMEADDTKRIDYKLHDGWQATISGTLRGMNLPSDHTPIVLDETDTKWLQPPQQSSTHTNKCNDKIISRINTQKITLSGVVETMTFAGSPSFWGNITHGSIYIGHLLFLDCPIHVDEELAKGLTLNPLNQNKVSNTSYGQLLLKNNTLSVIHIKVKSIDKNNILYKSNNGKCVKITGFIKKASLPLDQTPIILDSISNTEWFNRNRLPCL
jgi:hypothetical protein